MRKTIFLGLVFLCGCKLTGQPICDEPYAETKKYVDAAKAQKIKVSLAEFSAIAEKDCFERHWKYAGWAQTLRVYSDKKLYEGMGDQACYTGYLTVGLVYNYLNDPTNATKKAHLEKALKLHRMKTLACGRVGYVPRGFQSKDCPIKKPEEWKQCAPPYENYLFMNKRGPSPGQYMGTLYGLFKAATLLKDKEPAMAKMAKDTLQDIGNDLVATGFILKKPDGMPTTIPFFILDGPKIYVPGLGHVTVSFEKGVDPYVNIAEKYNLNCLATMLMMYRVTGDPKFKLWYDKFIEQKRHKGVYRATIEIGKMKVGKGSSHEGTMAALEMLYPFPEGPEKAEYEKALEVWWDKTKEWECSPWYAAYYNMTKKDKDKLAKVVQRRLESWSGLPRHEIRIVNSNRPDIKLARKGIWGYVAADPLPRCESVRTGFWPVKDPRVLDGGAKNREYGALDFVYCYQYAKYLGLVK